MVPEKLEGSKPEEELENGLCAAHGLGFRGMREVRSGGFFFCFVFSCCVVGCDIWNFVCFCFPGLSRLPNTWSYSSAIFYFFSRKVYFVLLFGVTY